MSKKILVLECIGGISGNMMLGALVDLGLELGPLESELKRLGIEGFEIILKKRPGRGSRGLTWTWPLRVPRRTKKCRIPGSGLFWKAYQGRPISRGLC